MAERLTYRMRRDVRHYAFTMLIDGKAEWRVAEVPKRMLTFAEDFCRHFENELRAMDIYITRGCFRSKREMGWSGDINRAALMREVEAFIQQQGFTEYVPLTNYVIPTPLPFYKSAAELRANQVRGLLLTREMEERRREHYEKKEVRKARDKARAQAKREHKKNFVGPLQPWQLAKPNKVNYPPDATKGEIFVINMGLVGRALRQEREEKEQAAREKAARGDQQGSG